VSQKVKVTLTLPAEVMDAVRKEAGSRDCSRFIAEAVTYYIQEQRRSALRERLVTGYQASAERDRAIAEEWRHTEEEV
jgi:metal-responsive CopG/Arc/MetJ family transcriptional regulator